MQEKKFKCGVIVGRFSPIHIGHEKLINIALDKCKKVVLIITSNGSIDERNPYSLEFRNSLIENIYKEEVENEKLIITTFIENNKLDTSYGDNILKLVKEVAKTEADYIIYGNDKDITKCFSKEAIDKIYSEKIDRKYIPICATIIRKYLKDNNIEMLKKYLNFKVYDEIEKLKNI